MPPSVTLSWRIGRVTSDTLASGATLAVSTSFSCSIQARIPDSSPASGSSSSSGTFRRASRAMRATVSLSSDIETLQTAELRGGSGFGSDGQPPLFLSSTPPYPLPPSRPEREARSGETFSQRQAAYRGGKVSPRGAEPASRHPRGPWSRRRRVHNSLVMKIRLAPGGSHGISPNTRQPYFL